VPLNHPGNSLSPEVALVSGVIQGSTYVVLCP